MFGQHNREGKVLKGASDGLEVDLVVVDNASRDGSGRAAAGRHPQVRLIENSTNRGLSAAWNQGARAVEAPWILFLNPDVEISRGDLGAFVMAGDGPEDVAVVGPVIQNCDATIYESGRVFPGVAQAVGHAFLGPFVPGNRFTRAYRQTSWDRSTEPQGRLGELRGDAHPAVRARAGGRFR